MHFRSPKFGPAHRVNYDGALRMLDGCKHKQGTHKTLVSNKASRPNLAWQVIFCGLQELKK